LLHKRLRETKKERSFKIETKKEKILVLAKIFVKNLRHPNEEESSSQL
jgi:hypothetical protein